MSSIEVKSFPQDLENAITDLKGHYPDQKAVVVPALHLIQERFGYIPDKALATLGGLLSIPPAELFGTLTFYTMFRRQEEGRFHVNVCKNISCHLNGSRELREHLETILGIKTGETTPDGLFTLGEVECLGACTEAPVMEIDGEYHFRVTPNKAKGILEEYRQRAGQVGSPVAEDAGSPGAEDAGSAGAEEAGPEQ
jgi:NADH-quinone oxidoreductase subunit E